MVSEHKSYQWFKDKMPWIHTQALFDFTRTKPVFKIQILKSYGMWTTEASNLNLVSRVQVLNLDLL